MREQRHLSKECGVLLLLDGKLVCTQVFRFSSLSTAAGVLVDCSANGRLVRKDANGKTLKAIQDVRLSVV